MLFSLSAALMDLSFAPFLQSLVCPSLEEISKRKRRRSVLRTDSGLTKLLIWRRETPSWASHHSGQGSESIPTIKDLGLYTKDWLVIAG